MNECRIKREIMGNKEKEGASGLMSCLSFISKLNSLGNRSDRQGLNELVVRLYVGERGLNKGEKGWRKHSVAEEIPENWILSP